MVDVFILNLWLEILSIYFKTQNYSFPGIQSVFLCLSRDIHCGTAATLDSLG